MERFTAATDPGIDALNSLFAVDAVVDPAWGTASGGTYQTVTEAMGDGHRCIFIKSGDSAEDVTITASGTRLIGVSSTWAAAGSRVRSVTVASGVEAVTLENIIAVGATSHAFTFAGLNNFSRTVNCTAYNAVGNGFHIVPAQSGLIFDGCLGYGCAIGWNLASPPATEWVDGLSFVNCRAAYSDSDGFAIVTAGTGTSTLVSVKMIGCHSSFSAQQVSASGFSLGPKVNASLIGCQSTNNGAGGGITGIGFGSNTNGIYSHEYVGCIAKSNNNDGFRLTIASAKVAIVGCHSVLNTTPYVNHGSCPGVVLGTYGTNGSG